MKTCTKCNIEKEISEFFIKSNGKPHSRCKKCRNLLNKIWRDNRPNLCKERYAKERDKLLLRCKLWRDKNKDKSRARFQEYITNNASLYLLRCSKNRAKKRQLEHTLKEEDINIPTHCPVLGIPISHQKSGGLPHANSATIDRIDNNKGYIPGNVIVVSRRANVLKNDATLEELRKIVTFYDNLDNKK